MLSIIVNFFNNRREARNTLLSLTRGYQRNAQKLQYEVIALDNGSGQSLDEAEIRALGPEFSYRFVQTESVSPAGAINAACRDAKGEQLLVIIDGAHILSPGVLALTDAAFRLFPSAFVATVSTHLGPKVQNVSVQEGYNQSVEDGLLERSGWTKNGYALYSIAGAFSDGNVGWFGRLSESGCFGIRKVDYLALGGFSEEFQSPGGGLVNLDFFQRAAARQDMQYVMLLGEATFHQFHGGVASNAPVPEHPGKKFHAEYVRIRGKAFERVTRLPFFLGTVPGEAFHIIEFSTRMGLKNWAELAKSGRTKPSGSALDHL